MEVLITDLENPRGIGVDTEGALLVAEAGYGEDAEDLILRTGRLTRFRDRNGDGDFDDPEETERWLDNLFSFNSVNKYETGRDEVSGATDVLVHDDGRVFLSLDGGIDRTGGTFILYELDGNGTLLREINQDSNMTGIGFSPDQRSVYATQSTHNSLIEIDLERGENRQIVVFDDLYSGQQSVPAGLGVDPTTGDVLVALFSGVAKAEGEACRFVPDVMCDGRYLPLIPTDAKVVRVDPESGAVSDEVTGLTAAVDVAADAAGNVFVVEMAADYGQLFHPGVDLFLADLPALHGGYVRFSGRVTMYPAGGGESRILAEGLDQPTNITVALDGALYVSTGQGTPGRPIPGPNGRTVITGEVLRISGYK
ncbi:MAG: ScyD/ScyE family protein [bacterium]|nr:ScyD/ScyE family protein [bacterium]